ncbi:MAG TPA: extracellular solute-binding protein, partial [Clostridia bacterium]
MKLLKKLTALFICVISLISVFGLSGCGKNDKLRVFVFAQSHEAAIYSQLIKKFEQETGIKVEFTVEEENYFDLLNSSLQTRTAADVFYVRPGDVRAHANQKTVINLTQAGLITEDDVKDIWKQAIDFFRYDGKNNITGDIYALPKDYSQYVLGFNSKLIYENENVMARLEPYIWNEQVHGPWAEWEGVDLTVRNRQGTAIGTYKVKLPGLPGQKDKDGNEIVYTYDEFGALAYLCSNNTVDALKPVYGTAFWEDMCLMAYVWGNGGEFLKDNNTKVNFESQEFKQAYTAFLELNSKWYAHAIGSTKTGYELFTEGSLVFYPVGTWDIGYFNTFSDTLDYVLMPWPCSNAYANSSMAERQDKWKARVDSVGYGIYSGSKKVDQAVKFIKYLSLSEEGQEFLVKSGAQIPNIESMAKGAYLNNEIKDKDGKTLEPENKQLLLDVASGVTGNGHVGPTVYTYNDEWFTEFFTGAASKLW